MGALESLQKWPGEWQGTSVLWLPNEPTRESASSASVELAIQGKMCQITYTWMYDNHPQEGMVFISKHENQTTTGVFADSWHMDDAFMHCQGNVDAAGNVSMLGSYAVGSGPDWGWRIVIEPTVSTLRILMYNVSPGGEETLGFELKYT